MHDGAGSQKYFPKNLLHFFSLMDNIMMANYTIFIIYLKPCHQLCYDYFSMLPILECRGQQESEYFRYFEHK
jgi:hypothetical protein